MRSSRANPLGEMRRAPASIPDWDTRLTAFLKRNPINGPGGMGKQYAARQDLARQYITGQILPGERKSMQPISSRVPGAAYDQIQHFITYSPWDPEATYDGVIRTMAKEASGSSAGLIIDDTGNPKQGSHSPGVSRQHCSATGNVNNCQVAVTCACALPGTPRNADVVVWSVGMRLYLPKTWTEDPVRRREVGIPDDIIFHTKTDLALDIIANARHFGVRHRFIGADTFYGDLGPFRAQLRAWIEPYVLAVTTGELRVVPADIQIHAAGTRRGRLGRLCTRPWLDSSVKTQSPAEIAASIQQWRQVSWGTGTKGPLEGDFARVRVRVCQGNRYPTEELAWLLLERRPEELRAYLCWGLDHCSLEDLVRMAHLRWSVEEIHEELKRELGWDHFEGRKWLGWHHHAVLSQMALAFLAWLRMQTPRAPKESYPTLPEVRREIVRRLVASLIEEANEGPPIEREEKLHYLEDLVRFAG